MALDQAQQQDYDNHVEHLRMTIRTIMAIGSDDPPNTANDIAAIVGNVLADEYNIDIDDL